MTVVTRESTPKLLKLNLLRNLNTMVRYLVNYKMVVNEEKSQMKIISNQKDFQAILIKASDMNLNH